MDYRKLGKSDLEVSRIGFGCWAMANDAQWGPIDEEEAIRAVHMAIAEGVNFFDTAEAYGNGHSEEVLGRALGGRRDQVLVATKVIGKHLGRDQVPKALEASLRRLGTDYVDLYQIHWPDRSVPFEETMEALSRLKAQGKIRTIGVSNFGVEDVATIAQYGAVDSNQVPYSLFWRAIEASIVDGCMKEDIGIICYSPLGQGLLTGKFKKRGDIPEGNRTRTRLYADEALALAFPALEQLRALSKRLHATMAQVSLAWLLTRPGVTTVIAGAKNRSQFADNVGAARVHLEEDDLNALRALSQPLCDFLGDNPDMWGGSRYR
ncbi:MAG: aldo/keto reductase [Candidatus Latescibacteria bacterium]|nr:aldo/keto reductase [Candidatus Latescibacterota bacterium]